MRRLAGNGSSGLAWSVVAFVLPLGACTDDGAYEGGTKPATQMEICDTAKADLDSLCASEVVAWRAARLTLGQCQDVDANMCSAEYDAEKEAGSVVATCAGRTWGPCQHPDEPESYAVEYFLTCAQQQQGDQAPVCSTARDSCYVAEVSGC